MTGAAATATERLGRPAFGVVLGSGFSPLVEALGAERSMAASEIPGCPAGSVPGHVGRVHAAEVAGRTVWIYASRVHLYEGFTPQEVTFGVALLAAAGASGVLLTCAAGGLDDRYAAGDLVLVTDHLNLTGTDPIRDIPLEHRRPTFPDLQGLYDNELNGHLREASAAAGVPLEEGVLAAVHGPCYETPAEVRMLRALGADLVTMSTVPEAITARYHGIRAAALACVANRGAGMDGGRTIDHGDVLARVEAAVAANVPWIRTALSRLLQGA